MPPADREIRSRRVDAGDGGIISGYAAVFNAQATIAGTFKERIAPGAFTRTLRERDVVALLVHDTGRVLGRTSARTLRLREDQKGLWFEIDVDASTPEGQTAAGTVARGDIKGCSIGFHVLNENWEQTRNLPLRTILELELHEITLTAFPAYETTSATLRSREAQAATSRVLRKARMEMALRGIGEGEGRSLRRFNS